MGIDPGLDGGIAVIEINGSIVFHRKMPTVKVKGADGKTKRAIDIVQISGMIAKFEPDHVFLEKAQAMPKNGAVSMFNYGVGYGMILGICLALEQIFRTELVRPQEWQKLVYGGEKRAADEDTKQRAMRKLYELWPQMAEGNMTHDGIIDALLIAEFGRRSLSLN